jgi:hypothetical protein
MGSSQVLRVRSGGGGGGVEAEARGMLSRESKETK